MQKESLVAYEKRILQTDDFLVAEIMEHRSTILSLLSRQDEWLVGATDGFRQYDGDGRLLRRFTMAEGWPQCDIPDMALFQQNPVLAVRGTGLVFWAKEASAVVPEDAACRFPTALLSTPQGDLWVGTRGCGLLLWNNAVLKKVVVPGLPHSFHATHLAGDSTSLWVGTFAQGLWHYSGGTWRAWTTADGLPDNQITTLALDPARRLCAAGTPMGGLWIQGEKAESRFLEGEFIESLVFHRERFFASTRGGSVLSLNPAERPRLLTATGSGPGPREDAGHPAAPPRLHAVGNELFLSSSGDLWRVDAGWRAPLQPILQLRHSREPVLADRFVNALATDDDRQLWVGYFDAGLDIVSMADGRIRHWRDDLLFCINHLHHDPPSHQTFVSTANGLAVFSGRENYRLLRQEEGLIHNSVSQTLPEFPGSTTVLAATAGGLTLYEPFRVSSLYAYHGLPGNQVYSLAPTPKGIYIGTLGGLSFWNRKDPPRNYTPANSPLRHSWVNALLLDGETLWIGTCGGGIQTLDSGGAWNTPIGSLSNAKVNPGALYSWNRLLFIGTMDKGFYLADPRQRIWAGIKTGLLPGNVTSFVSDSDYVYVGTDLGLIRFSLPDLQASLSATGHPFDRAESPGSRFP